jgi:hypothetical protein
MRFLCLDNYNNIGFTECSSLDAAVTRIGSIVGDIYRNLPPSGSFRPRHRQSRNIAFPSRDFLKRYCILIKTSERFV